MRIARWRLRSILIVIASLAVLWAGALKWRRYADLRDRIAKYSEQERLLLEDFRTYERLPRKYCGNELLHAEAIQRVAAERRRWIEACEREIWRIW
jgi:hypothetical protein